MLHLNFFGAPEIYQDEQPPLHFRTRKAQALLIYLAVTERSWSRDALATLFWPETDDSTARKNLRDILPTLRKQLDDYLHIEDEIIGLDMRRPYKCDVTHFCTVLERPLQTISTDTLVTTLTLYRGEFLEGYASSKISADFEMWVVRERERLHQLALMGFTTLCRRQQEIGDYTAALITNRQLLKLAPWDEATHRRQMLLLAQSGQQAAALAHFESCRQILAEELDVEPDAETVRLYAQIQAGAFNELQTQRSAPLSVSSAATQLPADSPPADKATIPNNLSTPLAVFVGRQNELTSIRERLTTSTCRLLTIVGPGGMGKSSLSLAVGQQFLNAPLPAFPDGIFWVPLTDINTAALEPSGQTSDSDAIMEEAILRAIAEALSAHSPIRLSSIQQLHAYLRPRRLLLILDNLEHLLAGTQALVTLLTQAPQLKILATARARLDLRGEHLLVLDSLSLPTVTDLAANANRATPAHTSAEITAGAWQASEAVAMFFQRAQQFDPDFIIDAETIKPVVQICHLVEGLPLGIELATSMLPLLSCHALAAELAEGLDFLETDTRDLPREQRTLRAVFEYSWRLLSVEGQELLARLAIFPGSFQRDAAVQIAGASFMLLKRLIDQSLVNKVGNDRFSLHRTVRAFAEQKLQQWPAEIQALRVQYARFYLEFLARQRGKITAAAVRDAIDQIQIELDNVYTAWRWAVTQRMYRELYQCLITLYFFYEQNGFYLDAIALFELALSHFAQPDETEQNNAQLESERNLLIGSLHSHLGFYSVRLGRFQQAEAIYESSWAILKEIDHPEATAICLGLWGASSRAHDPQKARNLLGEALRLARANEIIWFQEMAGQALGEAYFLSGMYHDAEQHMMAAYDLAKQTTWPRSLANGLKGLAQLNVVHGRYHLAEAHLREAVALTRLHHLNQLYVDTMTALGQALRLQGQFVAAKACYLESRKIAVEMGIDRLRAPILWEEGCLAEQCGSYREAKALFRESLSIGLPYWWAHALPTLGWALIGLGELEEAATYFQEVAADAEAKTFIPILLDAEVGLASITVLQQANGYPLARTTDNAPSAEVAATFRSVYHHPSATQQTRDRIAQLAAQLGVALGHGTEASATITN